MQTHYTEDEAYAILGKSAERQPLGNEMSRAQLESIAAEIGVSPEALADAEAEWNEDRKAQSLRRCFDAKRRGEFRTNLVHYVAVNTFLLFINLFASPGYLWVLYPVFGWGLGLFFDAMKAFQTGPEAERAYENWLAEYWGRHAPENAGPDTYATHRGGR